MTIKGEAANNQATKKFDVTVGTPGTTNAVTYTVGASSSWQGSIRDLYINDRGDNDMRGVSTLLALEVRGN